MAAIVLNCPWRDDGRCPDDWYAMTPTADDPNARECPACGHRVTLSRNRDQALLLTRDHRRVALDESQT
jgi:hypothetical protein